MDQITAYSFPFELINLLVKSWKTSWKDWQCFANISKLLCLSVCYVTSGENRNLSRKQKEHSTITVQVQIIHGSWSWSEHSPFDCNNQKGLMITDMLTANWIYSCARTCEMMMWFVVVISLFLYAKWATTVVLTLYSCPRILTIHQHSQAIVF